MTSKSQPPSERKSPDVGQELARRLDRHDRLLRGLVYVPVAVIVAIVFFVTFATRSADKSLEPARNRAKVWSATGSTEEAAKNIAAAADAAREASSALPYRTGSVAAAVQLCAAEIAEVKAIVMPAAGTVEQGDIPSAVRRICASPGLPPETEDVPLPLVVYFSVARAELPPDVRDRLQRLVTTWTRAGKPPVRISAYTDTSGSTELNRILRRLRAEAVRQVLYSASGGELKAMTETNPTGAPKYEGYGKSSEYLRVAVVDFDRS